MLNPKTSTTVEITNGKRRERIEENRTTEKESRTTTSGGGIGGYTPFVALTVNVTTESCFDVETSPAGVEGCTET